MDLELKEVIWLTHDHIIQSSQKRTIIEVARLGRKIYQYFKIAWPALSIAKRPYKSDEIYL